MVEVRVDIGIGGILRAPLQAVLADHHGAALAGRNSFGDEQDSVSEDAGPNVQHTS
jgi:hypothetical protein